ncbi:hypothetical protein D3C81_1675140 [compost metagenome]
MVVVAQFHTGELATGRRFRIDIHGDVVHRATTHADQLALRAGALEMQSAQHAARRSGVVILNERQINTSVAVALDMEALKEESASIAEYLWLDDQHAR